jgi:PKD repeat protein
MFKYLLVVSLLFNSLFGFPASVTQPTVEGIFKPNNAWLGSLWFNNPYRPFTVTITTANGSTGICPGGTLVLTTGPVVPGSTYQWFNNGTLIASAIQSDYTATVVGSYTVTVTTAGVPDTSSPFIVILLPSPVAGFTHSTDNQCSSMPLAFTSTSTGSNLTYAWDFGDPNSGPTNNTSTLQNPNHKFVGNAGTSTQTFTVRLTVTNDLGCGNSITANVRTLQRPGTQLNGNTNTYNGETYFTDCTGGAATMVFSNQSSTKATNTAYTIKWGDSTPDFIGNSGFTGTTSHPYVVGNYFLSFIVTGSNGCIDTTNYKVFVGGNPSVGLGNPGNTSTCTGTSITFPVTNTANNPPGTTYTVTFNDGTTPKVYTTAPDTITHYFNKSSCGTTSGAYSNSFSATIVASNPCNSSTALVSPIYVSQKPQALFNTSKDISCVNNIITFTNTSLGNNVSNNNCAASKFVWTVSPATGWIATASDFGDDAGGSAQSSLWQAGATILPVRFTSPGTYTIKLQVGSNLCGNDVITKTICINAAPTASFTTDVAAGCGPLAVKATNTSPLPNCGNNTYQWTVSPNSGFSYTNGTSATSVNPEFLFNNAATYTLSLVTKNSNGDCTSATFSKAITITVKPTVSTITAAASVCEGNSLSPSATVTSSGTTTYLWTFQGGTPSTSTSLNPGAVTYTTAGAYTTTLEVTNSCGTTTVTKAVTVAVKPTVNQLANVQFCAGDPSGSIGFIGSPGATFSWTNSNTNIGLVASGTGNIASFTTKNTGNVPITATVTVTPGGGCSGVPMTFTITVNPRPTTATTDPDAKICIDVFQLNGNAPLVGTGSWTQTSGPAAALTDQAARNATVSGLVKGTHYQWTWTISNGTCTASAKAFNLDVLNDIVNTIKTDATATCPGQSVHLTTDVLLGGDVTSGMAASYSYIWESSTDGVNWSTVTNATTANLTVTPAANVSYRRKVRSYSQCEVISNVIAITLNAGAPTAAAGSPLTICNQTQAQLQANDPGAGFTGTWTDDATGSNLTFSPDAHAYNATVSGLLPGQVYHLTWTINSASCGLTTSKLTLTDLAPLTNNLAPTQATYCFGQAVTVSGTATGGTSSYTYTWESSPDQVSWTMVAGQSAASLSRTAAQTLYYRRNVFSSACSLVSNAVQVIVLSAISNNTISAAQQICNGQPINLLSGSAPTGGDGSSYTYQWQQSADNNNWTTISSAQASDYQPSGVSQSTYYRRLVSSGLCSGAQQNISASVKITINPNAKAEFTASTLSGCIPFNLKNVITGVPHDDVNSTYTWLANGSVIGTGSVFPAYTVTTDGTQVVIKLVTTSKFGCDTNSMSKTFQTTKGVVAAFTKDQVSGCGPLLTHFTNTSAPIGGGSYSWNFGNGSTSSLAQPAAVTFQPNPKGGDTTYYISLKAVTSCGIATFKDSLTVSAKPKAIFTPDQTSGCSPFTVHLTNQSRGKGNNYTFSFGNGDQLTRADNQAVQYVYNTTKTDTLILKLVAENGCGKDSSFYRIVVYPNSVQANLVVNGDNKSGCAPFGVTFANNSTGANTFFYDFGDGNTATTTAAPETLLHTFMKAGVFTVKMTASNGCSTQSTTQTITVLTPPQVSFTSNQLQYCIKEPALFSNTTLNAGNYTYNWDFGDGSTTNDLNPKHSYVTAGNFQVKLTAIQRTADGTMCASTVSQTITVLAQPSAIFSSNAATLNCSPFTYKVNSAATATTLSWSFGDLGSPDNTATGSNANHVYLKAGVYQVQMIAYNQNGCADTTLQLVRVTESPKPQFTTADTVICGTNARLLFNNKSTYSGGDLVSYRWFVNNVQVSAQKDLDFTFNVPAGTPLPYAYRVKLLASSTIGCADTVTHTVLFNPTPIAKFSLPSTISCAPFALSITNTSQNADQFQWFLDGQLVSTDKVPLGLVLKIPNKTYILKMIAGNSFGCPPDQVSIALSTYPKPTAAFSLTDSVSCNGKLDIKVTNLTMGANSYTWNFGDGLPDQTGLTPLHTYGIPGDYILRLIAFNGTCRDTVFHHVQVAETPKAAFTASVQKGCSSLSPTFENLSVNSTRFLWDFGDGTFSTSKNPTHTYNSVKSPYTVKLTAYGDYGCTDEAVMLNYITVTPAPVVEFVATPDSIIQIPDHTFNFKNNTSSAATTYKWDFGDGNSSAETNPVHSYGDAGVYSVKLTATNADGCSSTKTKTVKVLNAEQYLYVPNAFEPGSSRSELKQFNIRALGLKTYSLRIFNKWGQLVFETTALDNKGVPVAGWNGELNGQPAPLGVYIWQISAWFIDGTEWRGMKYKSGDTPTKTGMLNLIR